MLKSFMSGSKIGQAGWFWTAAALLPLALIGCQARQPVQSRANSPEERVAGERQEQGDTETMRVAQEASLPATFAFGGRTWRAHQLHWVSPNDEKDKDAGATAEAGGATGTPGTTSTDAAPATGVPDSADTDKTKADGIKGFVAVGAIAVDGHQVYRRSDADEAVTDNIYLKAENVRPTVANSSSTNEATGTTPSENAMEGTGSSTTASTQTAFIEYDADENLVENVELSRILQATSLPATFERDGKTWKADEVQVYDPDVFDKLKPAPHMGEHVAFAGDKKDELWLQADLDPAMLKTTAVANTTGTDGPGSATSPPASEGGAPTAGTAGEAAVTAKGPIFVQYEVE